MRQVLALAAVIALAVACGDEFAAAGGGGGAGGSGGSAGPCDSPSDCPDPQWCVQATCEEHRCGTAPRAAGAELPESEQTEGDCQLVSCDGTGHVVSEDDPDDVPDDDESCTEDLCVNGAPENEPVAEGVECGEAPGMTCDGAGTCVGCTEPSQCGDDTSCQTPTCNQAGECGMQYVPDGTPAGEQEPGDCQKTVCDGSGNTEDVADDNDPPISPNDCVEEFCESGVVQSDQIEDGDPCDGSPNGRICCSDICCDVGEFCTNGACSDGP